jgi:imidazolonepropionase
VGPLRLVRNARVVTPVPPGATDVGLHRGLPFLRGRAQGRIQVFDGVDLVLRGDAIEAVGKGAADRARGDVTAVIDAGGRAVLPGFVDAHTHACWAGSRLGEWEDRLAGASYAEILAAGGGILATVEAVRGADVERLTAALEGRVARALSLGTTTLEVKSGYGLTAGAELKMLEAIGRAGAAGPATLVPTALLGHALDPGVDGGGEGFVRNVLDHQLPAVTRAHPGIPVDAFCEAGAWSLEACVRLFEAARAAGHPIRVHTDQFTELGMVPEALRLGARSVDHLEASSAETLAAVGASGAAAVLLPVSGFHLDGRYADGRRIVAEGGAVVVATNWNPGSAPSPSIPLAVALAVRHCGLTVAEAITAVTWNAAVLLGLPDRGWIGPGARADLVLLHHRDERELAHTVGENPVAAVLVGGARVTDGAAHEGWE